MGSWTSDAQRNLANRQEDFEAGELTRRTDYLYAARDVSDALTLLQMGAGHHPSVKEEIDAAASEITDIISRMSTWETMEEDEAVPEEAVEDLRQLIDEVLELSMEYRGPDFKLEHIRH